MGPAVVVYELTAFLQPEAQPVVPHHDRLTLGDEARHDLVDGGGSGLAVIGGDDDPDADAVTRMFRQAQRNAAGNGEGPEEGADQVKVTVYSNGFVVGDGPFRPSDGSEENEAFLRDVGRGIVPRELEDRAGAGAGRADGRRARPEEDDVVAPRALRRRLTTGRRRRLRQQ